MSKHDLRAMGPLRCTANVVVDKDDLKRNIGGILGTAILSGAATAVGWAAVAALVFRKLR